jgi:hypothetical protein
MKAQELPKGSFKARVSRVNKKANMVRIRSDYKNRKYLNKKDIIELFNGYTPNKKCKGYVLGKTNEYFLFKIPGLARCGTEVKLTTGGVVFVHSDDLAKNLEKGTAVVEVLLKKKMAMGFKKDQRNKMLETYIDKVAAVNARYKNLRTQLEMEWRKELTDLEEDKAVTLREYKSFEIELDSINEKLQQYKIYSKSDLDDRWALDKEIYRGKYD